MVGTVPVGLVQSNKLDYPRSPDPKPEKLCGEKSSGFSDLGLLPEGRLSGFILSQS
jgi:hypothetical protein